MKKTLLFLFVLLTAGAASLQAQTLAKGDQYAWNGFHAGDSVLLSNATGISSSSAPEQDLHNVFLSSELSRSSNYWNGVYTLGVLAGLSDDNIFVIEAAPKQMYSGSYRESFYLRHANSAKYVRCTIGFAGDVYNQGKSELVSDVSQATSFFAQNARNEGASGAFLTNNSVLLAHVDGGRLLRFGPFANYSFTYYGAGDKDAWNVWHVKWQMPITRQSVRLTTSKAVGEEMTIVTTSLDDTKVDWGDGELEEYPSGVITGTVKGADIVVYGTGQFTGFDCSGQQVTAINTDDMPRLISLSCADCELTTLSVSENRDLQEIDCSGNQLKKLLLDNEKLTMINCANNLISSLNVTKLSQLRHLFCGGNQLASITLGKSPELRTFWCQDNKFKTLNLSACPELRSLYASRNLLTNINLSADASLEDIWCDDNNLTKLDLGEEAKPTTVNCARNEMSELIMAAPATGYKPYLIDQSGNHFLLKDLYATRSITHYFYTDQDKIRLPFTQLPVGEFVDMGDYMKNMAGIRGTISFYDAASEEPLVKGSSTTGDYYMRTTEVKFRVSKPTTCFKVTHSQYPGLEMHSTPFIVGEDSLDGIDASEAGADNVAPVISDLQGRRVTNPRHGIYIVDGKKMLIK